MTDNSPLTTHHSPPSRRIRFLVIGVLTLVVLVLGWQLGSWITAPGPPAVSLTDADPAVAKTIDAARREVWWKPRSAAAWGRLGQLLRAHGYLPESNHCFDQAGRLDPDEPRWPYLHGTGLQSNDPEAAVGHLQRAADLCGGVPDAPRLTLAEVCFQLGRLDESESHFRQVLGGDNARAHLGLGRLAIERGRPRDALAHLERSATSPLTQQASRVLLAQAYQQLGDATAAARERALAVSLPGDPPWPDPFLEEVQSLMSGRQARLARLQTLNRQGRTTEMKELARQLEKEYPDIYWLVEGRGQMGRDDFLAAESAFRKAIELAPHEVDAHLDLGTVLFQQRNYRAAADSFRKVTDLDPIHGPAYLRLGRCMVALEDQAEALWAFQAAVRYSPQQAEAHRELGELLARQGRTDEAVTHLRQALQLQPGDSKSKELLEKISRKVP
ncbi:MAG TPA: tetratricopeptide repeat protein [Gemmataceae bacterium]|nr:tetratricopeptide repeat protein [Gemmataceae bacterium]